MSDLLLGAVFLAVGIGSGLMDIGRGGVPIWLFLLVVGMLLLRSGARGWRVERRLRALEEVSERPTLSAEAPRESPIPPEAPASDAPEPPPRTDAELFQSFGLEIEESDRSDR